MAGTCAGLLQLSGYYGDEYYFYLWAGMHKPHWKVAGLVLSVLVITSSQAIWLSG